MRKEWEGMGDRKVRNGKKRKGSEGDYKMYEKLINRYP